MVPSVNYLKKKKAGSYQLQQLKEEMDEEEEKEEKEENDDEPSDEDDELLVKTGVSTVSISNQDLPSLEKKKVPKRIRISVSEW